jgi:hypothetical protein
MILYVSVVHARRNRSLTKEEVDAFWKQRRRRSSSSSEEDGGDLASPLASPAARVRLFSSPRSFCAYACIVVVAALLASFDHHHVQR